MEQDKTLPELLAGIFLIGVMEQILLLLFFENHLYNAIGLWCGIGLVMGLAVDMKRSIVEMLGFPTEAAKKYMRSAIMKRMVVACVCIAIVFYFDWGNALTLLAGIFALKLGAYTQPLVHRVCLKWKKS